MNDDANRRALGAVAVMLLATMAWGPGARAQSNHARADLDALRARVAEITSRLRTELAQQRAEEVELERIEVTLGTTTARLLELEHERSSVQAERDALEDGAAALARTVTEARRTLGTLVRAGFSLTRRSHLQRLLGEESAARTGRALSYARYLHRRVTDELRAIEPSTARLAGLRTELARRSEQLDRLIVDARRARGALEDQRETRARVLAKLNLGIQSKRESLLALGQDAERLGRLVEELGHAMRPSTPRVSSPAASRAPPAPHAPAPEPDSSSRPAASGLAASDLVDHVAFTAQRGRLAWPVRGRLAHRFGTPRAGESLRWQGIWLQATPGTVVRAVSHGQVAFADWLRGFGLLMIIDHGDGYMSLYGHNATLLKQTGDWVDSAQAIARVGDSGGLSEAALYFELRKDGRTVDPLPWLGRPPAAEPQAAHATSER